MSSKVIILLLISLAFSCQVDKKSKHNKVSSILSKYDYLKYIDNDICFQESLYNSNMAKGWICFIDNDSVKFSGEIVIKSSSLIGEYLLNSLCTHGKKNLHSSFEKYALITKKEYFLPLSDRIDNPCEYYKDTLIEKALFYSEKGSTKWNYLEMGNGDMSLDLILNQQ